ncbi:hypothetical protein GLOIN_2v1763250 [Rhizophagus irregularis DAOM 181602=DAOM 197198]|nr:hypothetical protein GLOIN_2v1763250 [Rhizophagus irregularis DAOM 181602=DAOM 197198]
MKLALCEFSSNDFNDFPDSLYLTRKKLGLNDQFYKDNPAIMKCQHIEFSNSSVRRSRLCNTALSEKISASTNQTIIRPNLMYPFAKINQQLATMFCRPGRENLLTLGHFTWAKGGVRKKQIMKNGQYNFAGMDDVGYSARDSNER